MTNTVTQITKNTGANSYTVGMYGGPQDIAEGMDMFESSLCSLPTAGNTYCQDVILAITLEKTGEKKSAEAIDTSTYQCSFNFLVGKTAASWENWR